MNYKVDEKYFTRDAGFVTILKTYGGSMDVLVGEYVKIYNLRGELINSEHRNHDDYTITHYCDPTKYPEEYV